MVIPLTATLSPDRIALRTLQDATDRANKPRDFGFWLVAVGLIAIAGTALMFLFSTPEVVTMNQPSQWTLAHTWVIGIGVVLTLVGALLRTTPDPTTNSTAEDTPSTT
jgi:protein-S-isoprenylcysteine O-methyltransferase Ste14